METIILSGAELDFHPILWERIFKFRHRVFVENLGWKAIHKADGLEIDAFDTDGTVHFVILNSDTRIAAYSRLNPTTGPHLLANAYPEMLQGKTSLPQSDEIWEWSRATVTPRKAAADQTEDQISGSGFAICPAGKLLYVAIIEWCLSRGIQGLSLQCDPALSRIIGTFGRSVEFLAESSLTTEKQVVVPLLWHLDENTPRRMRQAFGLPLPSVPYSWSVTMPLAIDDESPQIKARL